MKKFLLILLFPALSATSFSQSNPNPAPEIKTDYLEKSRKQKTAARVLLYGGSALASAGLLIATNNIWNGTDRGYDTGMVLFYTGCAAMVGSIPLFIAGARNKRKAMLVSAGFNMEKKPETLQQFFVQGSYPVLSLKIGL